MEYGRSIPLSDIQKQIIIGTSLGDGCLTRSRHKVNTACLRFSHSTKQKDYCNYKYEFLKNISNRPPQEGAYFNTYRKKIYGKISYESIFTKEFYDFYKTFYPRGKKIVPKNIADMLSPMTLAFWYMDDGSIETNNDRRKGKVYYVKNTIRIHTNGFTRKESEILSKALFDRFGLVFKIKKVKCNGSYTILYSKSRKNIEKFIQIIQPYLCSSMEYKIKTSYLKPMKKIYTKDRVFKLVKKLNINKRSDFSKYRKGKHLYNSVYRYFKSLTGIRKLIDSEVISAWSP